MNNTTTPTASEDSTAQASSNAGAQASHAAPLPTVGNDNSTNTGEGQTSTTNNSNTMKDKPAEQAPQTSGSTDLRVLAQSMNEKYKELTEHTKMFKSIQALIITCNYELGGYGSKAKEVIKGTPKLKWKNWVKDNLDCSLQHADRCIKLFNSGELDYLLKRYDSVTEAYYSLDIISYSEKAAKAAEEENKASASEDDASGANENSGASANDPESQNPSDDNSSGEPSNSVEFDANAEPPVKATEKITAFSKWLVAEQANFGNAELPLLMDLKKHLEVILSTSPEEAPADAEPVRKLA